MCCRYVMDLTQKDLAELLEDTERSPLMKRFAAKNAGTLARGGEVRLMSVAPAIASGRDKQQAVFPMRWGFTIQGRPSPIINARVETAAEKPSFREAWRHHRCILPASRYLEWQHPVGEDGEKLPAIRYEIRPCDAAITWLCGLYRIEDGLPVFVVLTTEPSPDVAHIHDRMPLMLPPDAVGEWVKPDIRAETLLPYAITRLEAMRAR